MDSTDDTGFHKDYLYTQNSLDTEEFLEKLEQQSSGRALRPSLSKKDTMDMSLDRSESLDQPTDYGNEYDDDDIRQGSLESAEGYPMMSPPPQETSDTRGRVERRKSSLEILGEVEKKGKSVSFEEEPPKPVPERQTTGMTAREKWIWACNRICSNLAVCRFQLCFKIMDMLFAFCSITFSVQQLS